MWYEINLTVSKLVCYIAAKSSICAVASMKSYDDLQRFKEKTQTTHIEFKDMSEQARNSDNTNWAIIKQLVSDGADTVLDNSQRINVITPQLADPSAFIPPTSPPVPEAEPLPPFKALVPAQQSGSLLDSISSSLKPVTQPEAPISAPPTAPAVSPQATEVQLTKVAELRPESVALAGSSLFEQLAQQSPIQPAPPSAPPSPENSPAQQAFSPPTAQTPHQSQPHQVSAESLHQLLQEQLPPNPDYPSRPVQPLQPSYQSQPQPVTPPQGYQPQPQPVSSPQGYQPQSQPVTPPQGYQPQPQPLMPPQGYQPQPQPVTPPQGYQPQPQPLTPPQSYQPQPVSPPPGYQPQPQPNYQSLLQQMPPQPGYSPQMQQVPLQPGYPQPGYSSQLQQMSPPMGYPQPPLPGYSPQQPGYPSQLQQVPPQQAMPYYQPQPLNGPMMQRNVFSAAVTPNISYKQLFSPASELADQANSKEMLLQSLLEKIASCR